MKSRSEPRFVDAFERKEFEIIFFVEPRALEVFEREIRPASKREGIDRELDVRMLLLPGIGLVIENLQITVANLQEIDMACDEITFEVELEPAVEVVGDVIF